MPQGCPAQSYIKDGFVIVAHPVFSSPMLDQTAHESALEVRV